MATTEDEGGTGGKFRKRPLRRVSSTPYDRPPLAARGICVPPSETEAGGSRWFSKLVDPTSRVIIRSASRLFSVFGKGLAAPPGENINVIEEVPEVKSSPESREQGENPVDVGLLINYDASDRSEKELISEQGLISSTDAFFELEQLLKQKRFSRKVFLILAEMDHLADILHSRTIEPSTLPSTDYKNKGKINEDSSINSSSSQQAINHEEKRKEANPSLLEGKMEQLVNLHGNATSRVHVNVPEEGFDSPIEIARAYLGSKPRRATSSTVGSQSKICQSNKVFPLSLRFENKLSESAIASKSGACFPITLTDSANEWMTRKPRGRSALYKLSRSPYCKPFVMTNPREYTPYKDNNVGPTRSVEWTPSLSSIRHCGHGQALKRGRSDRDAGYFDDDARRVRQKSCLNDLNLSTHGDTSSTFFLGREDKHVIDLKGLDYLDDRIPSTSIIQHVPSESMEMAKKILHQLDKLKPSPQNKSEKKVIVGAASFSKSSLSALRDVSLKVKASNDSTKLLNVRGSRFLEEPSSSNLARITSFASHNKDTAEGEASLMPYIAGAEVVPVTNHSMKSMDSNSNGFTLLSMQKEPATVQGAPDDKVESTKAEHDILVYGKEPWEKSSEHSLGYVPISGLMHTDTKAFDKAYTERNVSFNFLSEPTSNTLSKPLLSSTIATNLADGATPKMEDSASPLEFGSKVVTYSSTKPISTGISARLNAGSLSAVSSSTGNGAPKFQFGSGNSTSYSFTGVSAVSSSTGIQARSPVPLFVYPHSEGSGSLSTPAVFPISANGAFGVSTSSTPGGSSLQFASSSYQNTARNFFAVAGSSCGTQGISSGNGVTNFSHKSIAQFGALDSQAVSGVKPFTSCFSSSSGNSFSSTVTGSFSTSSSTFLLSSSSSTSMGSTPSGFSFGMPTNASGILPFVSSRSIMALESTGTTTSVAPLSPIFGLATSTFGSGAGSLSNDQMIVHDSRAVSNLQRAPMAPTLGQGQPTFLQSVPSGAQIFQFGSYQNNSAR
ncbi:hypothetical protein KFK09_025192 [Dendrobium nobile]|uniref:Nuclear pore complex protein n=1 Tax=Dendrobium nobile TaxID=94219 RepID=A0A8T3ALD6_DENNO|nr:hypothetical protein KFK09_025192 [Dendrobium nobile]